MTMINLALATSRAMMCSSYFIDVTNLIHCVYCVTSSYRCMALDMPVLCASCIFGVWAGELVQSAWRSKTEAEGGGSCQGSEWESAFGGYVLVVYVSQRFGIPSMSKHWKCVTSISCCSPSVPSHCQGTALAGLTGALITLWLWDLVILFILHPISPFLSTHSL